MLWLALAFPIVAATILAIGWKRKVNVWEFVGLFMIPLAFIAITRFTAEYVMTHSTEYWGGYVVRATYYEPWNEYIHRTCTGSCGKDCTYTYDCSYVAYYPAYWEITDSNGESWHVSQNKWQELVTRWHNKHFVDMHRPYYTIDGDAYVTDFDAVYNHAEITTKTHLYENRVQASHSIFNFPEITKNKAKELRLFDHPPVDGYQQVPVLGIGVQIPNVWDRSVDLINGFLGKKCKARVFVLMWRDKPLSIATNQQAYWKNGNKNELTVCIGVDAKNRPQWCFPFGWTKLESLKADTRDFVMKQKTLDVVPLADMLYKEIYPNILRRDFREFSYIVVDPPLWVVILTFMLVIGFCFGWGIWSVENEYDGDGTCST